MTGEKPTASKKPGNRWLYLPAILVLGVTVAFITFYKRDGGTELLPSDQVVVAQGKTIYQANCASCHGANLEGQANWQSVKADGKLPAPPHDVSGHTWHHASSLLFGMTKFGPGKYIGGDYQSDMPAFENVLSDAEIVAVLSYIKSQWPPDVQASHDQINREYIQNNSNE